MKWGVYICERTNFQIDLFFRCNLYLEVDSGYFTCNCYIFRILNAERLCVLYTSHHMRCVCVCALWVPDKNNIEFVSVWTTGINQLRAFACNVWWFWYNTTIFMLYTVFLSLTTCAKLKSNQVKTELNGIKLYFASICLFDVRQFNVYEVRTWEKKKTMTRLKFYIYTEKYIVYICVEMWIWSLCWRLFSAIVRKSVKRRA